MAGFQVTTHGRFSSDRRGVNILKEYRNYVWITDKDGRIINERIDIYNHAMDAGRYAMESLKPKKTTSPVVAQGSANLITQNLAFSG